MGAAGARAATNGESEVVLAHTLRVAKSGDGDPGARIVRSISVPPSPWRIRTRAKVVASVIDETVKHVVTGGVNVAVVAIS